MSTHTRTENSIHREVVVAAPIERAFRVFTEDFDRVKPREHNMLDVEKQRFADLIGAER